MSARHGSSQVPLRGTEIDEVVLGRADEVLEEIFGEMATQIIYDYVEQHNSLRRADIPERLDAFMEDLEKLLGSGAVVVKKAIEETYAKP